MIKRRLRLWVGSQSASMIVFFISAALPAASYRQRVMWRKDLILEDPFDEYSGSERATPQTSSAQGKQKIILLFTVVHSLQKRL